MSSSHHPLNKSVWAQKEKREKKVPSVSAELLKALEAMEDRKRVVEMYKQKIRRSTISFEEEIQAQKDYYEQASRNNSSWNWNKDPRRKEWLVPIYSHSVMEVTPSGVYCETEALRICFDPRLWEKYLIELVDFICQQLTELYWAHRVKEQTTLRMLHIRNHLKHQVPLSPDEETFIDEIYTKEIRP